MSSVRILTPCCSDYMTLYISPNLGFHFLLSWFVIHTMTQTRLRMEKKACLVYSPSLRDAEARTQGRNLIWELKLETLKTTAFWLVSRIIFSHLHYTTIWLPMAPTFSGMSTPASITNQKITPQTCP